MADDLECVGSATVPKRGLRIQFGRAKSDLSCKLWRLIPKPRVKIQGCSTKRYQIPCAYQAVIKQLSQETGSTAAHRILCSLYFLD